MKLNNKGFAITAVLYGILILFVILVSSYLTVLSARKNRASNLVNDIEEAYIENYNNQNRTIYTVTLDSGALKYAGTQVIYILKEEKKWYTNAEATTETNSITPPSITNKTFGGYYTEANGAGTLIINSSGTIVNNSITGDTILYAYWITNGGNGDVTE